MKLDELTQPGWEGKANNIYHRDKVYGASELRIPAVV
jgi:hypothetical protein